MLFSSLEFIFRFLPLFLICYFVMPGRGRNMVLFLGSLIFYAIGEPVYVLLMLGSIVVTQDRSCKINRKSRQTADLAGDSTGF